MSNIKLGNKTYSGVDTLRVKNADNESEYIEFKDNTTGILSASTVYVRWILTTDMGEYPSSTTATISLYFRHSSTDSLIESKIVTIDWENPVLISFDNVPTTFSSVTSGYGFFKIKIEFNESWNIPIEKGKVVVINSVDNFNTKIPQNIGNAINLENLNSNNINDEPPYYGSSTPSFSYTSAASSAERLIYDLGHISGGQASCWSGKQCLLVDITSRYFYD